MRYRCVIDVRIKDDRGPGIREADIGEQDDPNSPIAGMPVLEIWKTMQVFVSKHGQGTGCSGI